MRAIVTYHYISLSILFIYLFIINEITGLRINELSDVQEMDCRVRFQALEQGVIRRWFMIRRPHLKVLYDDEVFVSLRSARQ